MKNRKYTEHKKRRKNGLKLMDLFSGCGGFSLGFKQAGYDILCGVDFDPVALKTFKHNIPESEVFNIDLGLKSELSKFISTYLAHKPDVIIAGPPCQGFSLTGPRNFDDQRNRLYLAVFECVKKIKPKAFVIENVKGIAGLYGGEIHNEILRRFTKLGYSVSSSLLNSADYGVPQVRERMFIVGLRNEIGEFSFPKPIYSNDIYLTCEEAISDLPSRKYELGNDKDSYTGAPKSKYQTFLRNGEDFLFNHVATDHKEFVKEVISLVPEGGNHKDLPPGVGESRKFNEAWTRYHSKKPSRTIDTGHRNHFHYKYNRVPTIRENARLQSFPDGFIFQGTKTQQNKHVGNAVPPLLSKVLGCELAKLIKE